MRSVKLTNTVNFLIEEVVISGNNHKAVSWL
jgi:hypothetical protein